MVSANVGRALCSILAFRADLEPALMTSSPVDCIAAREDNLGFVLPEPRLAGADRGLLAIGDRRYLIVNADDLGRSPGVNRGVIEAHAGGIVTSASLMVRWPAAAEAAA